MEQIKPTRRTLIFDYWNINKKKKLIEELENSSKKSHTKFEDLSNELYYEIFYFLDVYHVYKAFYNLNRRIQNLLINSTVPLNINISSMSKINFQHYNRHIIIPNKHRIKSLYLSNPFIVDFIFSPVRITSNFIRLEILIFDNIKSKYLLNILNHLSSLPNLLSLIILPIDRIRNSNHFYLSIFRLPKLKYCKILLKNRFEYYSLPIATNITSSIEHLVINNDYYLNHLNNLLSYVPHLRRLTLNSFIGNEIRLFEPFSIVLNNLTHISLNMNNITFEQFESMSRNLFQQLQILTLSIINDNEYLNGKRWEQLILSTMSHLRIFNFQYTDFIQTNDDTYQAIYDSIHNQFSSSFWFERQWFFSYQFYLEEYQHKVIFYSINPYRKQYTLYNQLIKTDRPHHQNTNVKLVNHVNIQDEESLTNCINYFRNAKKLTLSHNFNKSRVWLQIILQRIIPLNQLTILVINCNYFRIEQLIKLLRFTPNIHTLTLNCQSINETDSILIQQSESFRIASNTNKIVNVTIQEIYSSENIKLVLALCPRLQQITIDNFIRNAQSIIRHVLLKIKTNNQHLSLLCMKNSSKSMVDTFKTLIESEELFDNYLIKLIDTDLYFWW